MSGSQSSPSSSWNSVQNALHDPGHPACSSTQHSSYPASSSATSHDLADPSTATSHDAGHLHIPRGEEHATPHDGPSLDDLNLPATPEGLSAHDAATYRVRYIKEHVATDAFLDSCELEDLVAIVAAFAKAHFPDHELFGKISSRLQENLWRADWSQMATVARAYSIQKEYDNKLFTTLADRMLKALDLAPPRLLVQ